MNNLFPEIEPFKTEFLKVSDLHTLYIEQSGNPKGKPIIAFHGGPGSQTKQSHRRFYDPDKYRIILYDQRGCGKSKPLGETKENTTQDLIEDIEKIRIHLGIDRWVLHGGSWGSTLALAYSEKHPQKVKGLILRGIFTFRKQEVDWFTSNAKLFFPDKWEKATKILPKDLDKPINEYLYNLYMNNDTYKKLETIESFNIWHRSLMRLVPDEKKLQKKISKVAIAGEKIIYYYIRNKAFLKEGELLKNVHKISHIPTVIIQGRYDMSCPPITAWELHKKLPNADFFLIPAAGHKADEPGIMEKIIEYTNKYSNL